MAAVFFYRILQGHFIGRREKTLILPGRLRIIAHLDPLILTCHREL